MQQLSTLTIEQDEVEELKRRYWKAEGETRNTIMNTMQMLLDGKVVIDFAESLINAGPDPKWPDTQIPSLAICRGDSMQVFLGLGQGNTGRGTAVFSTGGVFQVPAWATEDERVWEMQNAHRRNAESGYSIVSAWPFPRSDKTWQAPVPVIPPNIKEKFDLSQHHVIWEPVWESVPIPEDPILCKRIDNTLLFVEVARWDITPLESRILNGLL